MLLEALIAFVIAALSLAGLYQGATVAIASADVAQRYEQALSRARSRLDAVSHSALSPSDTRGEDGGGYTWRVRVSVVGSAVDLLAETDASRGAPPRQVSLYAVDVAVAWQQAGARRQVQLATETIGPAAAIGP